MAQRRIEGQAMVYVAIWVNYRSCCSCRTYNISKNYVDLFSTLVSICILHTYLMQALNINTHIYTRTYIYRYRLLGSQG